MPTLKHKKTGEKKKLIRKPAPVKKSKYSKTKSYT